MPATPGETAALPGALAVLRPALVLVFVLALPLFLISTNVRWLTEDHGLYVNGFDKYDVGRTTRLSPGQLSRVADAFIAYFRGPEGRLDIQVDIDGSARPLFSEREIVHMEDVQKIVHTFHTLQLGSGAILALIIVLGFGVWRQGFLPNLGWMAVGAAAVTLGGLGLVGLLAALDFQSLFLRFHMVSFQNDFWMLDPSRDYLIMLFPYGFWLDATIRLALATAIQAVGVGLAGFVLVRLSPITQ